MCLHSFFPVITPKFKWLSKHRFLDTAGAKFATDTTPLMKLHQLLHHMDGLIMKLWLSRKITVHRTADYKQAVLPSINSMPASVTLVLLNL